MTDSAPKTLHIGAQLMLILVALIWGWTFVVVKSGLAEVQTFTFLFYRFSLAFLILLALFWPRVRKAERRLWIKGGIIGIALFAGYWFQTFGLLFTTATKSAFITGLAVVFVPVLGALFFKDRVAKWAWIGAVVSVSGLSLILFGRLDGVLGVNIGDLLALFCAISFALQIVLISHFTRVQNYIPILVAQIGAVALLSGIGMLVVEGPHVPVTWQAWEAILITGVLATALAFWAQMKFQPLSTAAQTAIIFAAEPMFGALFGYLLLGEIFRGLQWVGALLIILAMLVSQLPLKHKPENLVHP